MRRISLALFLILLLARAAFAQGVVVEAFVDKPTVALDDQFILTIRVKGANVFSEPRIPSRGNFDVLSRGSGTSVEMVNGRLSVTKEYTYILGPKNTGTFEIGPISVEVEGVEYKAGPISVTVVAGEPSRPPAPQAPPYQMMPGFPQGGMPNVPGFNPPPPQAPGPAPSPAPSGNGGYKDVFVTSEVDNKTPYVGQQVIFTFRFYTSRNVDTANLDLPDFHDFWSEEIQKEKKYYKQLGDTRYVVSEYKLALFPTKAGKLTVGDTTLKVSVEEPTQYNSLFNDPFFTFRGGPSNFRPRVLKAPPIEMEIKELPAGAPADFKGLVGSFKVDSTLSKKDLSVGETATLTVNVSGMGNLKDAAINPNFQIPNLKVYEDKPNLDLKKSPSGVSGTKSFKYALVPEGPGHMQVPPVSLSYFDPQKGTYESISTSAYEIAVVPGSQEKMNKAQSVSPLQATPVNPMAEDIATIHRDSILRHEEPAFEFYYIALILFSAPPVIFMGALFLWRRQQWRDANVEVMKKRKALSKAVGLLKDMDLKTPSKIPGRISHVMKEYLGDKLGRVGAALTPSEVEQIFSRNGKKSDVGVSMAQFLQQLDAWQYGGLPQEKDWESQTRKKAIGLLKDVERKL